MSLSHHHVAAAVKVERDYQDAKWGTIAEHPHDVGAWLTILRVELREAEEEWSKGDGAARALCEVLQIAAVAFACLQQHGIVTRESLAAAMNRLPTQPPESPPHGR